MRIFISRVGVWLWFAARWYWLWSRAYRGLRQRWARGTRLPEYESLFELSDDVKLMRWRRDRAAELWDAVSDPRAVWALHEAGKKCGDCDDISMFAVDRIVDLIRRCELTRYGMINPECVGMLTLPWIDGDGKAGGHNVCAFRYECPETREIRWAHVSNWHYGAIQWGFESLGHVAKDVLDGRVGLGWGWWSVGLKLMRSGWGERY